ncbi:centrosomal protein of 78 kDa [Nasonia vitripennis]|uniref:Centrosomal protein of 78 kDa n=1 Tax=Nasonia vitripennis TaxID=7425 RepID=A0A7M7H8A6_NASVI|nr:centrosomal protein of 78 kDa [Nasonia vitripennis]
MAEHSFATQYLELCRQKRLRPLPVICVTLPHSLDFTTDRVKMDDWAPILNSLSLDRTLRSISVRSKYQYRKLLDDANSETKARAVGKAPVVLTRFLLEWLSHSLTQCVRNSPALNSLELEGVPVPPDCLAVLCVGLAATKSLRHLSFRRCYIGDAGCEVLCRTLGEVQCIRSLDLSQCELTTAAGPALASALSRQKLALYQDAWKQSLRYREPKLESMPGLRRLTLNGNSRLGNEAVASIIEAIRDSLWFKALDLQQCGLSEDTGQSILELLDHNKTLVIVDVRLNPNIQQDTLAEISRRLECNELHSKSEYRWLSLPEQKDSSGAKRVSSAGNLPARKSEPLPRPRSAMVRQVKRPPAPVAYRKQPLLQMPPPQLVKRMKTKPPVPVMERRPRLPMKPPEHARVPQPEPPPKVSLHLDLQSQIQSLSDTTQPDANLPLTSEPTPTSQPQVEQPDSSQLDFESQKLEEIAEQLLESRAECDRFLEEIRRNELIIAEERARREFAEAKLRSLRTDLEEIQQRERDSRGYLLISQKSMEEICLSFGRLLDMLERHPVPDDVIDEENNSLARLDVEAAEDRLTKEDIKRRFALIIRKTKSENLKRGYFVDENTVLSRLQLTARHGRSEGNIRNKKPTAVEPLRRCERNIGDTVETVGLPYQDFREHRYEGIRLSSLKAGDGASSPGERARTLFASIVNGDALLGFSQSHAR